MESAFLKGEDMQDDANSDKANVWFPPPLLYVIGMAIGTALHYFAWPLTLGPSWSIFCIVCGIVVAVLGLIANALSFAFFRRTGQRPEPWKPTPSIVSGGIYRYTRNPMYVGMALIQAGIGIGTGALWIVVMVVPVMVGIYFTAVRPEEAYLESKFGEEYLRYKSSVRRWI